MDLEDACHRCSIILFAVGFSLLVLIYIPQTYSWLHLGFQHFLGSIVILALSGMFMLIYLYFFLTWGPTEYEMPPWSATATIRTKPVANNPNLHKHRRKARSDEPIDFPSRKQLNKLKEMLDLNAGSLQYKKRGQGVYHVLYDRTDGKYHWTHIGNWLKLKEMLHIHSNITSL